MKEKLTKTEENSRHCQESKVALELKNQELENKISNLQKKVDLLKKTCEEQQNSNKKMKAEKRVLIKEVKKRKIFDTHKRIF